jgi:hypothetical protein
MTKLAEAFASTNRAPLLPALATGQAARAVASFAAALSSHGEAAAGVQAALAASTRHSQAVALFARAMNTGKQPTAFAHARSLVEGMQPLLLGVYARSNATSSTNLAALINATAPKNTALFETLAALSGTRSPGILSPLAVGLVEPPVPSSPVRTRPVQVDQPQAEATPGPAPALAPAPAPVEPRPADRRSDTQVAVLVVTILYVGVILPIATYWILGPEAWDELRSDLEYLATVWATALLVGGTNRRQ